MKNQKRKLKSELFGDIAAGIKKKRKPDEYELGKIANAWMIVGITVFIILLPGRIVTDTLSVRDILDCSITAYNQCIALILDCASLAGCYYLLSQGVCHWQGMVLLIGGLDLALDAGSILMDVCANPIPFFFIVPAMVLLLVSMEIVYRKGRAAESKK